MKKAGAELGMDTCFFLSFQSAGRCRNPVLEIELSFGLSPKTRALFSDPFLAYIWKKGISTKARQFPQGNR